MGKIPYKWFTPNIETLDPGAAYPHNQGLYDLIQHSGLIANKHKGKKEKKENYFHQIVVKPSDTFWN